MLRDIAAPLANGAGLHEGFNCKVSHDPTSTANALTSPADRGARAEMLDLINGFRVSRIVWAAAALGLADRLDGGPKRADELAAATGMHPDALARLLRALVAIGLLEQEADQRFRSTPLGATLRTRAEGSLRAWALFALGEQSHRAWGEILHSLRSGTTGFEHVFGMDVWAYRDRHRDQGRLFDEAMASLMAPATEALTGAYAFGKVKLLVDVGGGDATLLIALLRAHPGLRGMLYDRPEVAANAKARIDREGLADRCAVAAGDALDRVPEGGDCYLLARVIHDWDDARAQTILRNCRRAMPADSRLLLIERLFPEPALPSTASRAAALSDLTMLVSTGGRERSEAEYRSLLGRAGLELVSVRPAAAGLAVVECAPASRASPTL